MLYVTRFYADPYPDKCVWQGPIKDRYISSYDHKTVTDVTEAECKKACEDEETFYCESFDYYTSVRKCYLSRTTRYDVALSSSTSYAYYEYNCQGIQTDTCLTSEESR